MQTTKKGLRRIIYRNH